jgi:lysyl-tRNA synthetase class 2
MTEATLSEDWNDLIRDRYRKVEEIRDAGEIAYPNGQAVGWTSAAVRRAAEGIPAEELPERAIKVDVAGRVLARRGMGKAAFLSISDRCGRIQLHVTQDGVGEAEYEKFKKRIDIGDIVWAEGTLFVTKTGELTVRVSAWRMLTKGLRPLPEKWHGLSDVETRYRQRYVDLIVNEDVREVFRKRSRIISFVRNFLADRDFLEVETPMMQPIAGGAAARPFVTHHNTLDMDLFLRIAPELYLKRLLVGGFERVFEINRNFRNEGISTQHNPEFTMVEFYQAYATVDDLMALTEELFEGLAINLYGTTKVPLQGKEVDFARPWRRLTVRQAVAEYGNVDEARLSDPAFLREMAAGLGLHVKEGTPDGKLLVELYEAVGERSIVAPTFVTEYPIEVSPLSRKNDLRPEIVDRFELIVNGREIANAFSELNDPVDQKARFEAQLVEKARGDEEAMAMDEDYVRALEYGMPPAAGEGIGIDRLVMLFTDSPSIRDVILFPQLRKEG